MSPVADGCGNVEGVSEQSLESAYLTWSDDLVRYAASLVPPDDAADVVADAITSIINAGERRWRRVEQPRAFLFRAVLNHARMYHRARGRRRRRRERLRSLATVGDPDAPFADLLDTDVDRALDGLSPNQRAAVILTYWDDLTSDEVAEILGVRSGTVKQHLARARRALRTELEGSDH